MLSDVQNYEPYLKLRTKYIYRKSGWTSGMELQSCRWGPAGLWLTRICCAVRPQNGNISSVVWLELKPITVDKI